MIAFRNPRDPSTVLVKRVVALPGEEVVLKEGAVWVNGVRLTTPAPIARLEYAPLAGHPGPLDSPDRPWRLKDDEFCVIGDFTKNSSDSRVFGAVPRSGIVGVVTVLYWPPARWQVWR
jgi:signal peptidase I